MQSSISRRTFFKSSAQTGLALAGLGLIENFSSAVEPLTRAGKARFLFSIAAYSFREFLQTKDPAQKIDLFRFIDFCAEQGSQGAELTSYYFPQPPPDEYLIKLRRHAFLRGVEVSGTAVGNNFALPKGEKLTAQIGLVKRWINHAAVLGAPHIRVFAGKADKGLTDLEARKMCIASLEECSDYAATKGIFLGLENHGGIVAQADGLLEIVRAVKSPWLGINLDTGNFHTKDVYGDIEKCAPYAVNVQMKALIRQQDEKAQEPADLPRLFKILRDVNYQGYIALEYESKESPWTAIPPLFKRMKELAA